MKDTVDRVIGVIDENGIIISCSELVRIGEYPFDCEEVMCFFKDEDQDFLYTKLSKYVTLKNEINICI